MIIGRPGLHNLELDITYRCGMGCLNCNRLTAVAPAEPGQEITVGQIERLIAESVRLRWPWRRWFLLGGEPTLHPDLDAILARIADYRDRHKPRLKVTLCTHGKGKRPRLAALRKAFPFLRIVNSRKAGPVQPHFVAVCAAPVDDPHRTADEKPTGCLVSWYCGIGMNYRGIYPCSVAGAIDRVFRFNRALTLADATAKRLAELYAIFCPLCGHLTGVPSGGKQLISPTWRAALDRYAKRL